MFTRPGAQATCVQSHVFLFQAPARLTATGLSRTVNPGLTGLPTGRRRRRRDSARPETDFTSVRPLWLLLGCVGVVPGLIDLYFQSSSVALAWPCRARTIAPVSVCDALLLVLLGGINRSQDFVMVVCCTYVSADFFFSFFSGYLGTPGGRYIFRPSTWSCQFERRQPHSPQVLVSHPSHISVSCISWTDIASMNRDLFLQQASVCLLWGQTKHAGAVLHSNVYYGQPTRASAYKSKVHNQEE